VKKIGIIGLGYWYGAFRLARALRESTRAKLVAVAEPDKDRLKKFTDVFPAESHTNIEDVLTRKDIEIVLVTPQTVDIPAYTGAAAEAGKHIILGPRMAMTLHEADRVVDAVWYAGVKTVSLEGEAIFENPAIKSRVERGEIGDIVHVTGASHSSIAEDWFCSGNPGWFADPEKVPGGAFLDYAIYLIHALRWYTGSEVKEINFARVSNLIHKNLKLEDWGFAFLTLQNGITATLEASWTITTPQMTKPSPKLNSYNRLELIGTEGRIITDIIPYPYELILSREHPYWATMRTPQDLMTEEAPPVHPFLDHLIECIDEDRSTVCTCEDAREALKVVLASYRAAKKHKPVILSN